MTDLDRLLERPRWTGHLGNCSDCMGADVHQAWLLKQLVKVDETIDQLIERVRLAEARVKEAEALLKDLPDHSDLDAAQFKINMVVSEANAKIRKLEARLRAAEEALRVADEYLLLGPPARAALRDALDTYDKKRKE